MFARIEDAIEQLRDLARTLESAALSPDEARRLVELAAEGERVCQALRAAGTQRALRTKAWAGLGYRTPAQWLAARAGTTEGQAITAVQAAHRLAFLPQTARAFAEGRISEHQVALVAEAANADRDSESEMLDVAQRESVRTLRERAREVVCAALGDEDVAERIRRSRYLRNWTERDGAVRLDARFAPDDGAFVVAAVTARASRLRDEAQRSGQRESTEAHAADALVDIVRGPREKAVVHVHVDAAALERGRVESGETCRIDGVGPVPVVVARRLAMKGWVKALSSEGADVTRVAHLGRTIPARLRTALETRDPVCAVPACEIRTNLEIDHIVPLSEGGATTLDNLARLCRYHHAMKTHRGWRLGGGAGAWTWERGARVRAP